MLRICISGLSSSGKTSLGNLLSKELNIIHVTKHMLNSYRQVQEEMKTGGDGTLEMIQTADKRYADAFDKEVIDIASRNDCVVTTWLGAWLIKDPAIRVWLTASFDERARRYANDHKTTMEDAKDYVRKKDELTANSFKEIYDIDIKNHSFFDMMINTERTGIEEAASLISMLAMGKAEGRFR